MHNKSILGRVKRIGTIKGSRPFAEHQIGMQIRAKLFAAKMLSHSNSMVDCSNTAHNLELIKFVQKKRVITLEQAKV